MNITNRVTMDITRAAVETTTCPAWLTWSLIGLGVAFTITAIVVMIKMWK